MEGSLPFRGIEMQKVLVLELESPFWDIAYLDGGGGSDIEEDVSFYITTNL